MSTTAHRRAPGRVLMIQGTASHVGKSTLVAACCRLFANAGVRVAPFKAQNMSLNAAVTASGGEIGRAQMLQAVAARAVADVRMNPVLLKPVGECESQLIVMGRVRETASIGAYYAQRDTLWPVITASLDELRREFDVVVMEGAGSPAEINLRDRDVVNMRVACYADAPVILVGDIERGGVFASLVGTLALLAPDERARVRGLVINKFRGDPQLLEPGPALLEAHAGVRVLGVLPYFADIRLPEEDTLGLPPSRGTAPEGGDPCIDIAVIRLPHLANFDDFDPLAHEPSVHLRFVDSAAQLGAPDLIILPGTKTTIADLAWLRQQRLDRRIVQCRSHGTPVLGICGGYQMLGSRILDPEGVESPTLETDGLGLLPVITTFAPVKATHQVRGVVVAATGLFARCQRAPIDGYEIHMGRTVGTGTPVIHITSRSDGPADSDDGALDAAGLTCGTYVHGLLHNDQLRRGLLQSLAARRGAALVTAHAFDLDAELDRLAAFVRQHLDWPAIAALTGLDV